LKALLYKGIIFKLISACHTDSGMRFSSLIAGIVGGRRNNRNISVKMCFIN